MSTSALLLRTSASNLSDELSTSSLATASAILQAEGLVAFPTETVYGLGASALSDTATSSIYRAKGRPSDNPLIVHVSTLSMLHDLLPGGAAGIPDSYKPLLKRFWPGPLSLIFPLAKKGQPPPRKRLAKSVTAGLPAVAVRMPAHALALALIEKTGLPLAAPSANMSSRPSPTTAEHVRVDLGEGRGLGAILDGGDCNVGVESTVVDYVPGTGIRVLRVGGVSAEELELCLRDAGVESTVQVYEKDFKDTTMAEKPTTPGMKYKHYSPTNSKVVLVRPTSPSSTIDDIPQSLQDLVELLSSSASLPSTRPIRVGLMFTDETLSRIFPSSTPLSLPSPFHSHPLGTQTRPEEAAQRLFAGLRHFDELASDTLPSSNGYVKPPEAKNGVDFILVECVPETGVGMAVMERAKKAAGGAAEISFTFPKRN